MVKTFENYLLQNQTSYDVQTWHVVSGSQVLQVCINDDSGLTLTDSVDFAFEWGNR